MNNFYAIYDAYENKTNIYDDVKNFTEKEHHSPNLVKLMGWLRESIQLQESASIDVIRTILLVTIDTGTLKLEAEITKDTCLVVSVERI